MILAPCGHGLCSNCVSQTARQGMGGMGMGGGIRQCPLCGSAVASVARNLALQQLIDNFVRKQMSHSSSLSGGSSDMIPRPSALLLSQSQRLPLNSLISSASSLDSSASAATGQIDTDRASADDELAAKYVSDYRLFSMRCRLLQGEFRDTSSKLRAVSAQREQVGVLSGRVCTFASVCVFLTADWARSHSCFHRSPRRRGI